MKDVLHNLKLLFNNKQYDLCYQLFISQGLEINKQNLKAISEELSFCFLEYKGLFVYVVKELKTFNFLFIKATINYIKHSMLWYKEAEIYKIEYEKTRKTQNK